MTPDASKWKKIGMARSVKVIILWQESNKVQARQGLTRAERRAKPIKAIGVRANSSSVESDG